ncbi:hypothetical protein ACP_3314 [Acidobacterium capsulatum ATCC 51196]|uniref:Uncharacterized protein n=1 Tax=Acidobacterium capsulatum (strain ATCC 51196 / DSM 11244 / BCRC 80197 / JCM 7670 / NBRC 15755 / NCIMB 13165 / 161) TaxID=240015 RepID=C1F684_ACIC5|nr:hypothetical protein ACP_3314 [Acidobacterium capsulatum ATCC 51196]
MRGKVAPHRRGLYNVTKLLLPASFLNALALESFCRKNTYD